MDWFTATGYGLFGWFVTGTVLWVLTEDKPKPRPSWVRPFAAVTDLLIAIWVWAALHRGG